MAISDYSLNEVNRFIDQVIRGLAGWDDPTVPIDIRVARAVADLAEIKARNVATMTRARQAAKAKGKTEDPSDDASETQVDSQKHIEEN